MSEIALVMVVILWVFALMLGIVVLGILRRVIPLLEGGPAPAFGSARDPGALREGENAPRVRARNERGEAFEEELVIARSVLVFSDAQCAPCKALADDIRRQNGLDLGVGLSFVIDDRGEGRYDLGNNPIRIVYQRNNEVGRLFGSTIRPYAFAISGDGVITGQGVPNSVHQLDGLARSLTEEPDTLKDMETQEALSV